MNETLLQAPVAILILASIGTSVICGKRKSRFVPSLLFGWGLFVLAFLYNDLILPALASQYLPREVALRITPDTPGTPAAMLVGGLLSAGCYHVGKSPPSLRFLTRS